MYEQIFVTFERASHLTNEKVGR